MDTLQDKGETAVEKDSEVTIEGLSSEISRLNDELTCASEAHHSVLSENQRLKEALRAAEQAFKATGDNEMVARMKSGISGEPPKSSGFKLPSSRRVA